MMKRLIATLSVLILCTGAAESADWIPLFNGKDLTGWTPKFSGYEAGENLRDTFRVRDGALVVDYSGWDRFNGEFGHLFTTDTYSRYRLRAEYRFIGDQVPGGPGWAHRNNGLMIHGQTVDSMGKDQDFPDCIEIQLLGGLGQGPRTTGNLIMCNTRILIDGKPPANRITNSSSPTFHGDQWVTIELEVLADERVTVTVNGEKVAECTGMTAADGSPLTGGTISIQAETHPIEFRKIELMPLD